MSQFFHHFILLTSLSHHSNLQQMQSFVFIYSPAGVQYIIQEETHMECQRRPAICSGNKKSDSIHGTRAKMTCLIKAEHAATQLSNTLESRTLSQSFQLCSHTQLLCALQWAICSLWFALHHRSGSLQILAMKPDSSQPLGHYRHLQDKVCTVSSYPNEPAAAPLSGASNTNSLPLINTYSELLLAKYPFQILWVSGQ